MSGEAAAAPAWLLLSDLPGPGGVVSLDSEALHYLTRVVRLKPGDVVHVTDGRGALARMVLEANGHARTLELDRAARRREAWVLCGAPEGERADWMAEKLAELGAAVMIPVDTARASWTQAARRLPRLERLARAALRQSCGRWLLEIRPPQPLAAAVAALPADAVRFVADPGGEPAARVSSTAIGQAALAIGPSPGWTAEEAALLAEAGFRALKFGGTRLRAETAAVALTCWWASAGGD